LPAVLSLQNLNPMSFLTSWAPAWLEGTYSIISHVGKVVWLVMVALWAPIVFLISLYLGLYDSFKASWDVVSGQIAAAFAVLTSSADAANAAIAAGWPGGFAPAVGYVNTWVPLTETFASLIGLLGMWLVCVLIRTVKSFIPTIN